MIQRASASQPGWSLQTLVVVPFVGWIVGMSVHFYDTLLSRFELIQGGLGDPRLNNFILEHTYRWLQQLPPHTSFFDPPVFYPQTNVSCYTELLIGVAPFYWLWRVLGFEPDTSYQLWMMVLATLNYIAAYLLLRWSFRLGTISSSIGSMLFAFNTAQFSKLSHQQLVPQFYVLVALMALFAIFRTDDSPKSFRQQRIWIFVFFLAWAAQFYTSLHTLFFSGLAIASAFVWTWFVPDWRQALFRLVRNHALYLVAALLLAVAIVWPAWSHYLAAADEIGMRDLAARQLPKWYTWYLTGAGNMIYGWISEGPFHFVRASHHQGIGLLTWSLAVIGLFRLRLHQPVILILAGLLTTVVLTTHLTDFIGPWTTLREVIPGAKAIRAVTRVGMVQLIPAAIGLGYYFQKLTDRRRWALLVALAVFCLIEQINLGGQHIPKQAVRKEISEIAKQVDPETEAFLLVPREPFRNVHELAEWVTLATGIPTLNGRYGGTPPGYSLHRVVGGYPADQCKISESLRDWCLRKSLRIENVQVIELDPPRLEPVVSYSQVTGAFPPSPHKGYGTSGSGC
jgi:hypothetical protein